MILASPDIAAVLQWRRLRRQRLREQLVQALVKYNSSETDSRNLVARIEQRRAWLCILYPDYMHNMADMLLSIG